VTNLVTSLDVARKGEEEEGRKEEEKEGGERKHVLLS
jgi:hypothetical protein